MFALPWTPRYTRDDARKAIADSASWSDALRVLGLRAQGKNYATLRKWAARWGIDTDHLQPYRPRATPRFTEAEARAAIHRSRSWTEALRFLRMCQSGANPGTLKKWAELWGIETDHFDPWAANREALRRRNQPIPLDEILVESSTYSRSMLKARLYEAGLKQPVCELCGQGEIWRGRRMGLILDHINGVRNDNRLENLRIACPNCAATLDTHCGRKNRVPREDRACNRCGKKFQPKWPSHRYCSRECGSRWDRTGIPRPGARRAERPPREQLLREIDLLGYLGVGRMYGVSDNAIRKWIREYERDRAIEEGRDPDVVEIPKRTWPNRRRDQAA